MNAIAPFLNKLVVICNGQVNDEGLARLKEFSENVYIRPNVNYDGGAYQWALLSVLGRETIEQYDELLLFNDTFYGPLYPLREVFDKMDSSHSDIWGLSMHGKTLINGVKKHAHIQSYFINVRNEALRSETFWRFWEELGASTNFDEAVDNFEIAFSETMEDAGFKLDSYLYVPKYQENDYKENYNYSQLNAYECIAKYRFPVFKRKNLSNGIPITLEAKRALRYIDENTEYPVNYIWDDVLRRTRLSSIQLGTGFDKSIRAEDAVEKISRACIIVYIASYDFYKGVDDYLRDISMGCDLFLFVDAAINDSCEWCDRTLFRSVATVDGDFWSAVHQHSDIYRRYDYVGICADNTLYAERDPVTRRIARKLIIDNCFASEEYIAGVIRCFEDDSKIGMCIPEEFCDEYWMHVIDDSTKNRMMQYLVEHGMSSMLHSDDAPFCGAYSFWIRSNLLDDVLEKYESKDADVWEKVIPYWLQLQGYYPRILLNETLGEAQVADYKRILWIISGQMKDQIRLRVGAEDALRQKNEELEAAHAAIKDLKVVEAVANYAFYKLYIYGCGTIAKKYTDILNRYHCMIQGYIVSDGEKHEERFYDKPIYELSSFPYDDHSAVLVGVGTKWRQTIVDLLRDRNIRNIIEVDDTNLFDRTKQKSQERFGIYESIMHQNFLQQLALDAAPYEYGPNHPTMKSSEELLDELISTGKSLVRYGDGEFQLMKNQARPWFQAPDVRLGEKLNEAFYQEKDNVIVAIPDILGDLRKYKSADQANIRYYLKDGVRESLLELVGMDRTYYDAYVSRPYLMYQNPEHGKRIFDKFKKLWKGKHVLLVEGEYMRSGVGNDLFDGVASMKRILCPSQNAFQHYDQIVENVKAHLDGIDLILCALGPTATVLAYELAYTGIQTIDLGQIDNEYEWCRMGATERVPIPGKAVPEIEGQHEAGSAVDETYLNQIIARIYC